MKASDLMKKLEADVECQQVRERKALKQLTLAIDAEAGDYTRLTNR